MQGLKAPFQAVILPLALVSCGAAGVSQPDNASNTEISAPEPSIEPLWSHERVEQLLHWVRSAPDDALPVPDTHTLEAALGTHDQSAIDAAAQALALKFASQELLGVASPSDRTGWHIADTDNAIDVSAELNKALTADDLEVFFAGLRPQHPDYVALRKAYATEADPARKATIARNMERWRWMPRTLGQSYVLVNEATFEARFWRRGDLAGTWRVVVGKRSTPSPMFAATITAVTFNPWWNIPASIVAEMRGRFPASKGYVRTANGWAQKPGPGNALGQMKLVMPNPYHVYMHDTPSKSLFAKDERAFSHGCIRVDKALDYASTLLQGARTQTQIDAIVASRKTTTVPLSHSIPVYVTYFTAGLLGDGKFVVVPDIYGRDGRIHTAFVAGQSECAAG